MAIIDSQVEARENKPFFETTGGAISERQAMRLRGIDPDAYPNRGLLEGLRPVEDFNQRYMNRDVALDAASEMLEPLRSLIKVIADAQTAGVTEELQTRERGSLIAASGTIFRTKKLAMDTPLASLCRDIAVAGASDKDPEFDHLPFDHPSWGSPSPRIEAAQVIGTLVWNHHRYSIS